VWTLREAGTIKVKLMLPQLEEDLEGSLPIICQVLLCIACIYCAYALMMRCVHNSVLHAPKMCLAA
jgi:hypothetical protein